MPEAETNVLHDSPESVQDDVSRKLTAIWKEILLIDSVGEDESFFDLGGDSALAVHLFTEIDKSFNVKLPLATLFEAQTIQQLAAILRSQAAPAGWSSLVVVQSEGSRPNFFCVHGAGGNILIYRDLVKHLGTDQPFYGLQSQGLDGKGNLQTKVEDMARIYLQEVRRVQPRGPYFLGGYCMGGTVAYEMAQQLTAQGESVGRQNEFEMDALQLRGAENLVPHLKLHDFEQQR
jgi:acyl carrier protein